ncbi:MAG: SoxR reducing system RseC family protein [Deltaproteobacteria bacterium]|nr:SoxR reducing system RseC family protein [Deltaproteobacteria bacterium]
MRVEVKNDLKAGVGDCVQLSVPAGSLMKLSLLVYFFPVVALIVGAITAGAWAKSFHMDATLASILGGGIAMGGTFCVLKWLDKRSADRDAYQPRMTRILPHKASHEVEEDT